MRLTPQEPEIGPNDGFTEANDLFGYADFGTRFANLVGRIDEPLVIVLDGPWGSGKSVFAKQWAGLLRQRGAPVIEFDAFANDFYEDAFVALAAQVYAEAKKTFKESEELPEGFLDKSKKLGKALTPTMLRVLTRAVTAGLLSLEDVQTGGDAVKAGIEALGSEGEKAIEAALTERLTQANEEQQEMEAFKLTLSELAEAMTAANKKERATGEENQKEGESDEEERKLAERREYPLVFIIDELDRCRPPFALSLIERIKHLFSVEAVCFVLVTHLPQLETVLQGAYGAMFDARTYLQKFYQFRATLPLELHEPKLRRGTYAQHLWKSLDISFPDKRYDQLVMEDFRELAETRNLSLREIERVITHIALAAASVTSKHMFVAPIIVGLCMMRLQQSGLYEKAQNGRLGWDETYAFLTGRQSIQQSDPNSTSYDHDWALGWWAYCLGATLPVKEVDSYSETLRRYGLQDPGDIILYSCQYIDDLEFAGREEMRT